MTSFLYAYAAHVDEQDLFRMECRALFGREPAGSGAFESGVKVDPTRSPFLKGRLQILREGVSLEDLAELIDGYTPREATFKVVYVKSGEDVPFEERRVAERWIGQRIRGKAEMRQPEALLGIAYIGGRWVFGPYVEQAALWLKHNEKPQHYSTALSTRVARAIVNIAVPAPAGVQMVDPCCGIGTVLVEAMSMGIDIVGFDLNWMAVHGARANLQHFGYLRDAAGADRAATDVVKVADMRTLEGGYDAAILDMPYNLCSKLSKEDQLVMLHSLYRLVPRAVIITIEPIEEAILLAGFRVTDRCVVKKARFAREVLLVERDIQ
jgi:tRNA G10  N-methylase Trm11